MRGTAAAALLLALAAVAAGQFPDPSPGPGALFPPSNQGLRPTRLVTNGMTHYFQLAEAPIGTIVFLHGCARSARNFFPWDPEACDECLGFPEHLSHTKQALSRGYNVLAMDPQDKAHLCWSSTDSGAWSNDQPMVIDAVTFFLKAHNLTQLPVYFWGASSGGTLALKLVGTLHRQRQEAAREAAARGLPPPWALMSWGIISEVATPTDFDASDASGRLLWPGFPPTVFIRMERDSAEADANANVAFLRRNGVYSNVITSPIRRVTPAYLAQRCPTITEAQSAAIVAGLKTVGLLGEDGYLKADPHEDEDPATPAYQWTQRLQALLPWLSPTSKSLSLLLKFSPIQQALMVAYARHDAVSDYFSACLAWLEARRRDNHAVLLPDFVARYQVPNGRLDLLTSRRIYASDGVTWPAADPGRPNTRD